MTSSVEAGADRSGRMLLPACVLSAVLAIAAAPELLAQPLLAWLFKPLTTVLVIVHAARRGIPGDPQRRAVLAGLGLSWLGDVALLWPQGFVAGLVAFLLAHLCYLVAFTRHVRFAARAWPFGAYALAAGSVAAWIWPGVPAPLRVPVLCYIACLGAMAAQSAVQWLVWRERTGAADGAAGPAAALLPAAAAAGGALFVLSDALLAINRFRQPLPLASLWILASYWAAQWLIASSLAPRRRAG